MNNCFCSADLLLPKHADPEKWAVIACDQFTSDPQYWKRVRQFVGDDKSILHMILPEAELSDDDSLKIAAINAYMRERLADDTFSVYPNTYIYVERTLRNGSVRQGMIGIVDLEQYDYRVEAQAMIRATEKTVLERVPPRVRIRENAMLEFSHVLMLCDDKECTMIEPVGEMKRSLQKVYDFDLMEQGGHIAGWLVTGDAAKDFDDAVRVYESKQVYLVGDGNHSLLSAKTCYENLKKANPGVDLSDHPSRYAMVELENVHSPAQVFEPIYRIITHTDPEKMLSELSKYSGEDGYPIRWVAGKESGYVKIKLMDNELPIGALQRFLDIYLAEHEGQIDYIHEADSVVSMASEAAAIGFLLEAMDKKDLFPFITDGNLLSRKAFSLGHGAEKRYYLEGRRIQ